MPTPAVASRPPIPRSRSSRPASASPSRWTTASSPRTSRSSTPARPRSSAGSSPSPASRLPRPAPTGSTQPLYRLDAIYHGNCPFDPSGGFGRGSTNDAGASEGGAPGAPEGSPLVVQDSIGPYDYAILKADSEQPMLDWLAENRYFV